MPKSKIVASLLAALVSAALLAACGGDDGGDSLSDQEYSDELSTVFTDISENEVLGEQLSNAENPEELAGGLEETKTILGTAADDLEALEPPADAEEGNAALVSSLRDFNAAVDPVLTAAEEGDQQALQGAAMDFQQAGETFQQDFAEAAMMLEEAGIPEPDTP